MAGEFGAAGRAGTVSRIESFGRPATPEAVWNAAVRAGVDPARMALSLCHVLATPSDDEDEPATVRYTLTTGREVEYDATFHNPFRDLSGSTPAIS